MVEARRAAAVEDEQAMRYYGKYRGIVTDNQDPRGLGRVRARVPEVLEDVDSGWALPCVPYAGEGSGSYAIPEPGTGVWIEFEAGSVSAPVWTGCWWASGQVPSDEKGTPAVPPIKVIRSETGLMVTMDDGNQTISVSDENGANIMTIEVQRGQITIKGVAKAVVQAPLIELVENAMHPVVFGDNLLIYLNQIATLYQNHMHPGENIFGVIPVTPTTPVPPFPPATIDLLSMKVKTG